MNGTIISRKDTAIMYMQRGEIAWQQEDYPEARMSFFRGVEAWKQAAADDSSLESQWRSAQKRFEEYMQDDELYKTLLPKCKRIIEKNPGIKQTELYKALDDDEVFDDDVRQVIYFAEKNGEIVREKKGRTYILRIAEDKEAKGFFKKPFG